MEGLEVRKSEGATSRVLTDSFLRVLKPEVEEGVVEGVYALGDAADIDGMSLPPTAEVVLQKAEWLAQHLSDVEKLRKEGQVGTTKREGFQYDQKALVTYIGRKDGIVDGGGEWIGKGAWLAWRSGSLEWTRSWRRRAMIVLAWVMNKLDGREIARRWYDLGKRNYLRS